MGEQLRDIRRRQGLSLRAVEERSGREFKVSVLGAYERGTRTIPVLRLQLLAYLYCVPVGQLLPDLDSGPDPGIPAPAARQAGDRVRIDLRHLEQMDVPEGAVLRHYIGMLQVQRGDFNGRVITIRDEDVQALAWVSEQDERAMRALLDDLGVAIDQALWCEERATQTFMAEPSVAHRQAWEQARDKVDRLARL